MHPRVKELSASTVRQLRSPAKRAPHMVTFSNGLIRGVPITHRAPLVVDYVQGLILQANLGRGRQLATVVWLLKQTGQTAPNGRDSSMLHGITVCRSHSAAKQGM